MTDETDDTDKPPRRPLPSYTYWEPGPLPPIKTPARLRRKQARASRRGPRRQGDAPGDTTPPGAIAPPEPRLPLPPARATLSRERATPSLARKEFLVNGSDTEFRRMLRGLAAVTRRMELAYELAGRKHGLTGGALEYLIAVAEHDGGTPSPSHRYAAGPSLSRKRAREIHPNAFSPLPLAGEEGAHDAQASWEGEGEPAKRADENPHTPEIPTAPPDGGAPGIDASAIARRLDISKSLSSQISRRLAERGLIDKRPSPDDAKRRRLTATEDGRAIAHAAAARVGRDHNFTFRHLTVREFNTMRRVAAKLDAASERAIEIAADLAGESTLQTPAGLRRAMEAAGMKWED